MNIAFYTGVSGMTAFQKDMDITAHNIANAKTTGYKVSRSSFSDLMYTEMSIRNEGENFNGHGVKNGATDLIMEQSGLNRTDQSLDFAIVGDGFFAVDRGGEALEYTRNGAFSISVEGKNGYLVSSVDGGYILDSKGKRISLPKIAGTELFDTDGIAEKLGIYSFPNPYGLERANAGSFKESETSGKAKAINNDKNSTYELVSGALEFSSVNLGDEMIHVIQSQRAFQMNSKIVKAADEIEEMINNLR